MTRESWRLVAVACGLLLALVGTGESYEVDVHQALSQTAVDRGEKLEVILRDELNLSAGRLTRFSSEFARTWVGLGSFQEDVPYLRVFNHFHNPLLPLDQAGLRTTFLGLTIVTGQSSLLWQQNPAQAAYPVTLLGFPFVSGGEDRPWQGAR